MPAAANRSLVPRPELVAKLLSAVESHPFTAIVAPAGYGKTSLASLAFEGDAQSAWYTAQLWHAGEFAKPLVREVRRARPDFGRLTQALASRRPEGDGALLTAWAQRLGASFAGELAHVDQRIIVVIEDIHLLEADDAFGAFIEGAMRSLPPEARLLLIGRRLPVLPLAEWLAQDRARVFTVDDLRFNEAEIRALAERSGTPLDAEQAGRMRTSFEGWAAGLALALATGDRAIPTSDGTLPATHAYLLEANIASLDADLVAFLEATAVFETLSTRVLERDVAFAGAPQYLQRLESRGVMLSVVRPGELYRIHPLLREALLDRVRLRAGTAAVAASHVRAAALLEEAGNVTAAFFHLEAAGDVDALLRFLRLHAYDSFIAGNGERVTRLARGLRARGVESPALFERLEGMLARQRGEPGAEAHFHEALRAAERSGDRSSELAARFLLTEDRLARREATDAAELATVLALAKLHGPLLESDATLFDGWRCAIERDFTGARTRAQSASALAGEDLVRRVRAVALEAYAALSLGDIAAADAVLGAALHELEGSDHVVLLANTLVWYARFALLWGDVAAARDYAEQGEALARRLQLPAELAGVYLALAEIAACAGDRRRCASAGEAARSFGASAWYAIDRARVPALTTLYLARATFAERGPSAALELLNSELSSHDVPLVCRAALEAEGAAYARLAAAGDANARAERAAELIEAAPIDDALDAVTLASSRSILAAATGAPSSALTADAGQGFAGLLVYRANSPGLADANVLLRAFEPRREAARTVGTPHGSQLTKRELEILELMTHGLTNKEIAQRFTLSPRTVDTHVERVLAKLNVGSRTRAVAAALRSGLVASP